MDNVNYNFEIVELLYSAKKANGNNKRFNKPILILLMAIIECAIYDFVCRINQHRYDSFPNITKSVISHFRNSKDSDELKVLIPRMRSQNLFLATPTDTIYSDLEHLRNVRNRLHIQNKYNTLAPDENRVFRDKELELAQECLEKVFDTFCNVYPRWNNQPISMQDFPRPWL